MYIQYLPWLTLVLAIVFFIISYLLIKKQSKKSHALELLVKSVLATNELTKQQLVEIHSGSIGMGKKIQLLESLVKKTQEHQQNLVAQAPENRLYTRAVKMVQLGATIEELMVECELPRAEAELLLNLHKK
jgi:RIO-like serine/threonine protein kinase